MIEDHVIPESVTQMLTDQRAVTAPLDEFRAAYGTDDNIWWSVGSGHHQNLFEEACEALDAVRAQLTEIRALCDAARRGRRVLRTADVLAILDR
jgi:hypothetical protein